MERDGFSFDKLRKILSNSFLKENKLRIVRLLFSYIIDKQRTLFVSPR